MGDTEVRQRGECRCPVVGGSNGDLRTPGVNRRKQGQHIDQRHRITGRVRRLPSLLHHYIGITHCYAIRQHNLYRNLLHIGHARNRKSPRGIDMRRHRVISISLRKKCPHIVPDCHTHTLSKADGPAPPHLLKIDEGAVFIKNH